MKSLEEDILKAMIQRRSYSKDIDKVYDSVTSRLIYVQNCNKNLNTVLSPEYYSNILKRLEHEKINKRPSKKHN